MLVTPTINSFHGRIKSITGTNPVAGAEILATVPDRRRWRLLAFYFQFTTDATVADRIVTINFTDGTSVFYRISYTAAHTASSSKTYALAHIGTPQFEAQGRRVLPIPPFILAAGFIISTSTINIEPGDDYTAPQLLVEEWIDP